MGGVTVGDFDAHAECIYIWDINSMHILSHNGVEALLPFDNKNTFANFVAIIIFLHINACIRTIKMYIISSFLIFL